MVSPAPDRFYASPSPVPDIPIIDPGTLQQWQAMYVAVLTHLSDLLKHGKAQEAYMQITQLMDVAQNYRQNGLMVEVANKSNVMNKLSQLVNEIQKDFDYYSTGSDGSAANDAQKAKREIEDILNKLDKDPKYAPYVNDIEGDVRNQLKAIFNVPAGKTLAQHWKSLWEIPNPSNNVSDVSPNYSGTAPVSNAINALRSDLESQSTILNSQMQTYSKEAAEELAFMHACYGAVMGMIKGPVSATRSAAS